MTFRELLFWGKDALDRAGIEDARTDAWLLLEYVTGLDRTHYFLEQEREVDPARTKRYEELIRERKKHIPLQHLTGRQEFMGFSFRVTPGVLIPRPETELLVLETLKRIETGSRVLDVCTGSGCIAVSLKKLAGEKEIRVEALDISGEALEVAEENARRLNAQVQFYESDLLEKARGVYDVIVSNPPYIKSSEIETLMPEVRDHEPRLALDGTGDGLYFYREIVKQAKEYLRSGGWLLFEIGYDQGSAVEGLLADAGYTQIERKKDLAGLDRMVLGRRQ